MSTNKESSYNDSDAPAHSRPDVSTTPGSRDNLCEDLIGVKRNHGTTLKTEITDTLENESDTPNLVGTKNARALLEVSKLELFDPMCSIAKRIKRAD